MPSTTDYLCNKFMKDGDDGIGKAEEIIERSGGQVGKSGYIHVPAWMKWDEDGNNYDQVEMEEFWDAVQFLCEEWDYAIL